MMRLYYLFLIWGVLLPCLYAKRAIFYRKDYTYMEEYDAFYKMHWDANGYLWSSAFKVCDDEGAKLFYPKLNDEWIVAQKLIENWVEPPNVTEIFLGLHNEFNLGEFITIDGHSTESSLGLEEPTSSRNDCVMMEIGTGQFKFDKCFRSFHNSAPFICKKVEDISCPTVDREYKYVKLLNKCYKVHKKEMDWNSAMQTCYMEGGLLAVLETDLEIDAIRPLLNREDRNTNYFVGFRKMFNIDEIFTIKGKIYENKLFRDWYRSNRNAESDCGVFDSNRMIVLENCHNQLEYICEMDLK